MLHDTRGWLRAAFVGPAILSVLAAIVLAQSSTPSSANRSYRSEPDGSAPLRDTGETDDRNGNTTRTRNPATRHSSRLSVADRLKLLRQNAGRRKSTARRTSPPANRDLDSADPTGEPVRFLPRVSERAAPIDAERRAMQKYALERYAERQRALRGSNATNGPEHSDPRNQRGNAAGPDEPVRGGISPATTRYRRGAGDSDSQAGPTTYGPNEESAPREGYGAPRRYGPAQYGPTRNTERRLDRFGARSSRDDEYRHSDFRQSQQTAGGNYSPVQPGAMSQPGSEAALNDRNMNAFGRPLGVQRTNAVTPAAHETQDGVPTLAGNTPSNSTDVNTPNDRLLLPQPERLPDEPRSNWDRLSDEARKNSLLSLDRMTYVGTVLAGGRDDVGMDDILTRFQFNVPSYPGLLVSTGMQATFLDGPTRTDLPPRLYNISLGFQWDKPIKPGLGLQLGLTPAFYSDFENTGSDAFRIMARVIGYYTTSPQTQWVFGFAYLDREDVRALPVMGVIHAPSDDLRFDLVFPKPRIAKRFSQASQWERWGYISGEYGGGSWGIKRSNGTDDIATYSDWKLIFGFEQRYFNGRSLLLELGYVFNREIEYRDGPGDYAPGETWMLRAGLVY